MSQNQLLCACCWPGCCCRWADLYSRGGWLIIARISALSGSDRSIGQLSSQPVRSVTEGLSVHGMATKLDRIELDCSFPLVFVDSSNPLRPTDCATHCETTLDCAVSDTSHFSFATSCDALLERIWSAPNVAFLKCWSLSVLPRPNDEGLPERRTTQPSATALKPDHACSDGQSNAQSGAGRSTVDRMASSRALVRRCIQMPPMTVMTRLVSIVDHHCASSDVAIRCLVELHGPSPTHPCAQSIRSAAVGRGHRRIRLVLRRLACPQL